MNRPYTLLAWELSYFSGKLRAYLRYKQLPFQEKRVTAWDLLRRIPARTGASVMPVLITPQGEWLQDTSAIIAALEARHPQRPVLPTSPRQRILCFLIEAWADEFWIPPAMHYRWSYPENFRLFEAEAGRALLPLAPAALRRPLVRRVAGQLRSYLPGVGVVPDQQALIERWTLAQLDALDTHFGEHAFLLGDSPSLADFALIGPLYAHLGRDPWPSRELIRPRPRLASWIQRVHAGDGDAHNWLPGDQLPASLQPVLQSIFKEFLPQLKAIAALLERCPSRQGRLPRALGPVCCPLADGQFERLAMPYTLWMFQRARQAYLGLPASDQQAVRGWLADAGQAELLDGELGPALERDGLKARLADAVDG